MKLPVRFSWFFLLFFVLAPSLPAENKPASPRLGFLTLDNKHYEGKLGAGDISAAMLGDSITTLYQMAATDAESTKEVNALGDGIRRGNWFLDDQNKADGVDSLFERLSVGARFTNYSSIMATVDKGTNLTNGFLAKTVLGVTDMSDQVSLVLKQNPTPNLVMIFLGTNNLDWVFTFRKDARFPKDYDLEKDEKGLAKSYIESIPNLVGRAYRRELRRLIDMAKKAQYPVTIVVFGLTDVDSYLNGLTRAEVEFKESQGKELTNIHQVYAHYPTFGKAFRGSPHREATLALKDAINRQYSLIIADESKSLEADGGKVKVLLRTDLATVDFSDPKLISHRDGLHPSIAGHNAFAAVTFKGFPDFAAHSLNKDK